MTTDMRQMINLMEGQGSKPVRETPAQVQACRRQALTVAQDFARTQPNLAHAWDQQWATAFRVAVKRQSIGSESPVTPQDAIGQFGEAERTNVLLGITHYLDQNQDEQQENHPDTEWSNSISMWDAEKALRDALQTGSGFQSLTAMTSLLTALETFRAAIERSGESGANNMSEAAQTLITHGIPLILTYCKMAIAPSPVAAPSAE